MIEKDKQNGRTFALLKRGGDVRDGLLVGAGILYALGYIAWSVNALINKLGLVPVLESQYFLSGIGPGLFVVVLYLVIKSSRNYFTIKWADWLGPGEKELYHSQRENEKLKRGKFLLRKTILICFYLSLLFICLVLFNIRSAVLRISFSDPDPIFLYVAWTLFILSLTSLPHLKNPIKHDKKLMLFLTIYQYPLFLGQKALFKLKYYKYVSAIPFLIGGILLYIFILYPIIPQELGGIRPRCAELDLIKEQLSNETIEALLPKESMKSNSLVVRSIPVDVFFSGGDFMLVKQRTQKQHGNLRTYEVKKEVVQAVSWCD